MQVFVNKSIRLGVLISALILISLASAACSDRSASDTPASAPLAQESAHASPTVAAPSISKSLPTPAATPVQPTTPTPIPVAISDPSAAETAAIEATRTAALSPPTPFIAGGEETDVAPIMTESPINAPLPTPMGIYSWTLKVPILMYHYISEPPPGSDIYRVDLSVSPDAFQEQMAFLSENGYTPVDLNTLSLAIVNQVSLPEKPVIITFDDGYRDAYEFAYPILQKYGFKGTFFVITELIDQNHEGYMTWEMVEEMSRAGQRIESHSKTHPDLALKSRDGLIYELLGSQQTIAAHTGQQPRYLCYPAGSYNEEVIQVLKELDYWGAVTTQGGTWHGFNDRFEWSRVRIRNNTSLSEFGYMVDMQGTLHGKPPG